MKEKIEKTIVYFFWYLIVVFLSIFGEWIFEFGNVDAGEDLLSFTAMQFYFFILLCYNVLKTDGAYTFCSFFITWVLYLPFMHVDYELRNTLSYNFFTNMFQDRYTLYYILYNILPINLMAIFFYFSLKFVGRIFTRNGNENKQDKCGQNPGPEEDTI